MNFLLTIKNSIYNPAFYRNIPKTSLGAALGYYFLFSLLVMLLQLAFLAFPIISGIQSFIQTATQEVVTAYPADLTIRVHNGTASINKPQPYIIPLCDDQNNCQQIIIDTRSEQTSNYFSKADTLVVITKNAFFLKDRDGQLRGYTLDQVHDFTLNKQTIKDIMQKISPWFPVIPPVVIFLAGLLMYIGYLFKLLYFFLLALILWLLAKRFLPGTTYGTAYKFAVYSITLGTIVGIFLDATGWFLHIYSFPFMGTILAIIVFVINLGTTPTLKAPVTKPLRKATKKRTK